VDFVTFDPWLPKHLRIGIVRLERNDGEIAAYEKSALAFLAEVEAEVNAWLTVVDMSAQMTAAL
jgi:hypothetical protein